MSFGSILLRVLLCVALAFNGVAMAHTGVHLQHEMSPEPAAHADVSPENSGDAMPCHGAGQKDHASNAAMQEPASISGTPAAPDCCDEGGHCACMQHATAALGFTQFPALVVRQGVWQGRANTHLPPAVLRLNRPPIA